jgi:3-hydroxyacyl-CoA dehydrogenase
MLDVEATVVGTGIMGPGIAAVLAVAGSPLAWRAARRRAQVKASQKPISLSGNCKRIVLSRPASPS